MPALCDQMVAGLRARNLRGSAIEIAEVMIG